MPIFIPVVIGFAVAGTVGAASAIGTVVKKRIEKKKREDEIARQRKSAEQQEAVRQRQAAQEAKARQAAVEQQEEVARQRQAAQEAKARQAAVEQQEEVARQRQAAQHTEAEREARLRRLRPYDKQSLVKALDQAIAKAANDTLDAALAKPPYSQMSSQEQTHKIARNANDMRSALHDLRMPDYNDEITVAAYLLNYHPSHVGLAHAIVNRMVASLNYGKLIAGHSGCLHVVDLASGTLAMQFGLAIAVADALVRGEVIDKVVIDSVDINPAMLKGGRIAWDNFVDVVSNNENLTALAEACRLIESHRYTRHDAVPSRDGECWLSCLHGVYRQSSGALKQSLYALHDKHNPVVGLMTCWGKSLEDQNITIATGLAPFRGANWQVQPAYFLEKWTEYKIPFLFKNQEHDASQTAEVGHRSGILPPSWGVFWRPTDTAVLTYQRNFPNYGH